MGWTRIEKQVEIAKRRLGPLKDPAFAHPSTLIGTTLPLMNCTISKRLICT